jgi:hypothetical protein
MKMKLLMLVSAAVLLTLAADSYGQGRGRGGGGGRPAGVGGGPPSGVGVDRGIGNASVRSGGRSDTGLGTASTRSNGRSTTGLDRARLARDNANRMSDTELNRYRGLSKKLGTTPEEMRARYEAALLTNPDLNYGNFVAAHVIADNMSGRFPNVTSSNILAGLANGDSIGETLRSLRLTKEQAKIAQRDAEDRISAAKRRNR